MGTPIEALVLEGLGRRRSPVLGDRRWGAWVIGVRWGAPARCVHWIGHAGLLHDLLLCEVHFEPLHLCTVFPAAAAQAEDRQNDRQQRDGSNPTDRAIHPTGLALILLPCGACTSHALLFCRACTAYAWWPLVRAQVLASTGPWPPLCTPVPGVLDKCDLNAQVDIGAMGLQSAGPECTGGHRPREWREAPPPDEKLPGVNIVICHLLCRDWCKDTAMPGVA
jgi:hypothetical protein